MGENIENQFARSYTAFSSRFRFNGKEWDEETGNFYYGARYYDPKISVWLSVDPLAHGGPERAKAAKSFVGTPYVQEGGSLRTGTDAKSLKNVDCSELVCRVLAADGVTSSIISRNTEALKTMFADESAWEKVDEQDLRVGDVFLWRTSSYGHTGIVTGINEDGTVEITHARGTKYGTVTESYKMTYFTNHEGWVGFFRPEGELEALEELTVDMFNIDLNKVWTAYPQLEGYELAPNNTYIEVYDESRVAQPVVVTPKGLDYSMFDNCP